MGRINQLAEKTTLNSTDVIAVDAGAGGNTNKMTGANLAGQLKALGNYQDKLTFDTTPTAGSTNPVTSGGVKTALDGKQNTLTFDTTPTAGSTNPVTSGGVATAIQQSTASKADIVAQAVSIRVVAGGYNTGSGNYFDFFVPLNVDMSKTYSVTLTDTLIRYASTSISTGFGACSVLNKQANGLVCELRFTSTQTINVCGTIGCIATISVA